MAELCASGWKPALWVRATPRAHARSSASAEPADWTHAGGCRRRLPAPLLPIPAPHRSSNRPKISSALWFLST
eukprot:1562176-Prymnesium_polylepis.1